ncbi:MAG: endonuclease III [Moraxellaceae bacterium]|nr:MAG: endonuclease III [Moraxellaceae bacterium]
MPSFLLRAFVVSDFASTPSLLNASKALSPNKKQRAALILAQLQARYPNPPIPLHHKDAFTLLIAVLLSAQCTDERVNQITPALFALADTPEAMARQPVEAIAQIIRPCGLSPQKSKAIKRLSELLLEHHNGQVPQDFKALEALPGVGHKTASVVMSQAFGVPAFAVDTHIHRLAQRWGLTSGKNVVQTEADLKALFPKESWNQLHLQFIYYGREFCSARGCDGTVCELCRRCYPNRIKAKATRKA